MADKQMPAGPQQLPKPFDQPLLRRLVKVNHHIPAQDDIERTSHRPFLHEVESSQPNQPSPSRLFERVRREPRDELGAHRVAPHVDRGPAHVHDAVDADDDADRADRQRLDVAAREPGMLSTGAMSRMTRSGWPYGTW